MTSLHTANDTHDLPGGDAAGSPGAATSAMVDQLCLQSRRMRAIPRLAVAAAGSAERLIGLACAEGLALFGADAVAVLLDDGRGSMRVRSAAGFSEAFMRFGACGVAELGRLKGGAEAAVLARSQPAWPALWESGVPGGIGGAMWVPIRTAGRLVGGILVARRGAAAFADDERLFAELLAEYLGARLSELALTQAMARLRLRTLDAAAPGSGAPASEVVAEPPLASSLRLSTHTDAVDVEAADAHTILGAVASMMERALRRGGVSLAVTVAAELPLMSCRPAAVEQALVYLLAHAQRAVALGDGAARRISLEAHAAHGEGGPAVELSVVVPAGSLPLGEEHAGLLACAALVRDLGGVLWSAEEPGGGSRLVVRLPAGGVA